MIGNDFIRVLLDDDLCYDWCNFIIKAHEICSLQVMPDAFMLSLIYDDVPKMVPISHIETSMIISPISSSQFIVQVCLP